VILDLSNLISTIITATAALVAIMGGFLVSRVITLASERNAVIRRLRIADEEIKAKKEILDDLKRIITEDDAEGFIENNAEEIFHDAPISAILKSEGNHSLTEEVLEPYVSEFISIRNHLIEITIDAVDAGGDSYSLPVDFDEFAREKSIEVAERKSWYEIIYTRIRKECYPSRQSDNTPWSNPFNDIQLAGIIEPPEMRRFPSVFNTQWHIDVNKQRKSLTYEIKLLEGLRIEQDKILQEYGKIENLWGGLAVLVYACFVGIMIPSTLLPYPLNTYNDIATKIFLLGLFFSELAMLFGYLGVSMHKLTTQK